MTYASSATMMRRWVSFPTPSLTIQLWVEPRWCQYARQDIWGWCGREDNHLFSCLCHRAEGSWLLVQPHAAAQCLPGSTSASKSWYRCCTVLVRSRLWPLPPRANIGVVPFWWGVDWVWRGHVPPCSLINRQPVRFADFQCWLGWGWWARDPLLHQIPQELESTRTHERTGWQVKEIVRR